MKINLATLALALVTTTAMVAQVGIGTKTPAPSAVLDLSATDKGFLPPRLSTADRDAISSPAEGLTIYNTTTRCLEFYIPGGWVSSCSREIVSGPCAGEPLMINFNGLIYRPVESTGQCWLDRNLGATKVADMINDVAAYGDLYQWGRSGDGHQLRTSGNYDAVTNGFPPNETASGAWDGLFITTTEDWLSTTTNTMWQSDGGINDPCPSGYRVPTNAEFTLETNSWTDRNTTGAINSPLKMPAAGIRFSSNGSFGFTGSIGYYRTRDITVANGFVLAILNSILNIQQTFRRGHAASVRCIKD